MQRRRRRIFALRYRAAWLLCWARSRLTMQANGSKRPARGGGSDGTHCPSHCCARRCFAPERATRPRNSGRRRSRSIFRPASAAVTTPMRGSPRAISAGSCRATRRSSRRTCRAPAAWSWRTISTMSRRRTAARSRCSCCRAGAPLSRCLALRRRNSTRCIHWLISLNRLVNIGIFWHEAPVRTMQDFFSQEILVGSSGGGDFLDLRLIPTCSTSWPERGSRWSLATKATATPCSPWSAARWKASSAPSSAACARRGRTGSATRRRGS